MAVPTNTVQTYDAIGNREDLTNDIWRISPTVTPVTSSVPRVSASGTYHEWQTRNLRAAGTNIQIEGDDATADTYNPSVRVGNYCQIMRKVAQVSGTQRAVDSAGRADELDEEVMLNGLELRRDIEFAYTQNQASSAGGAGTGRSMAGLESWLATNYVSEGTGTAQTTPGFSGGTVAAPTDSTVQGTFEEASLKSAIANCWAEGGNPTAVVMGSFNKRQASGFTGVATAQRDTGNARVQIIGAADLYVSDFGEHALVPDHFTRDRTALVLDYEYLALATLRDMETTELGKTGDSDRIQIIFEGTAEVRNEAASSKVADLTTS